MSPLRARGQGRGRRDRQRPAGRHRPAGHPRHRGAAGRHGAGRAHRDPAGRVRGPGRLRAEGVHHLAAGWPRAGDHHHRPRHPRGVREHASWSARGTSSPSATWERSSSASHRGAPPRRGGSRRRGPLMLNPVTVEVIRNSLPAAANEMAYDLQRTSYNMMIYEVRDYCCALLGLNGELLAQNVGGVSHFVADLGRDRHRRDGALRARRLPAGRRVPDEPPAGLRPAPEQRRHLHAGDRRWPPVRVRDDPRALVRRGRDEHRVRRQWAGLPTRGWRACSSTRCGSCTSGEHGREGPADDQRTISAIPSRPWATCGRSSRPAGLGERRVTELVERYGLERA